MISEKHFDRLASALATDSQMCETFLTSPLDAVEQYNRSSYVSCFGGKPIELTEEERCLLTSVKAVSIHQFHELLEEVLISQGQAPRDLPTRNKIKSPTYFNPSPLHGLDGSAA